MHKFGCVLLTKLPTLSGRSKNWCDILVISFQMIQEMHDSVKLGSCFSKHLFDGNRFE